VLFSFLLIFPQKKVMNKRLGFDGGKTQARIDPEVFHDGDRPLNIRVGVSRLNRRNIAHPETKRGGEAGLRDRSALPLKFYEIADPCRCFAAMHRGVRGTRKRGARERSLYSEIETRLPVRIRNVFQETIYGHTQLPKTNRE